MRQHVGLSAAVRTAGQEAKRAPLLVGQLRHGVIA
jgi:hypothetical protein